jgi:hypothetical protein
MTSCAAFLTESRMSFAEPVELNRKSGQSRDLKAALRDTCLYRVEVKML